MVGRAFQVHKNHCLLLFMMNTILSEMHSALRIWALQLG